MRKSKLKDGTPFYGIKIEHFVTKSVFATALASRCWYNSETLNTKMSKKEAMAILKSQLFHQGIEGVQTDLWETADEAFTFHFDNGYRLAIEWINKNYPYLK